MASMQYPEYRISLKQMKQYMRYPNVANITPGDGEGLKITTTERTVWRDLVSAGQIKKKRFEKEEEETVNEGTT
jgi:hypothetical protein